MRRCLISLASRFVCLLVVLALFTDADAKEWSGQKSEWKGYARHDFQLHSRSAIVVVPEAAAKGRPWIWRARFFGHRSELDEALLEAGYHVVYCDVANLFGSPK